MQTKDYTIENALRGALAWAAEHLEEGRFIKSIDAENIGDNDETVYSTISLFSGNVANDGTWEGIISDELMKIYPTFF